MAFDQGVDPKAGQRLSAPIEKDVFIRLALPRQRLQFFHRLRPERTLAQLIAFAANARRAETPMWHISQIEIGNPQLRRFVSARLYCRGTEATRNRACLARSHGQEPQGAHLSPLSPGKSPVAWLPF